MDLDIIILRNRIGTPGVSVDEGRTVISSNGRRLPVSSAWKETDEDLDLPSLTRAQLETLEGILLLREEMTAATVASKTLHIKAEARRIAYAARREPSLEDLLRRMTRTLTRLLG